LHSCTVALPQPQRDGPRTEGLRSHMDTGAALPLRTRRYVCVASGGARVSAVDVVNDNGDPEE
jgi:hypothetical protein